MNELSKLQRIDYEDFRKIIHTGDIVLCSGRGVLSKVIKVATDSPWSHIGTVIRDGNLGQILMWHSTMLSTVKDVYDDRVKVGVQTVSLSTFVATYDGVVGIRRLDGLVLNADRLSRQDFRNKPYELDKLQLAASAIDSDWPIIRAMFTNETDLSSIFCSEQRAELDIRWELLINPKDGGESSNEYTPGDYGDKGACELMYLERGVKIEPTVIVKDIIRTWPQVRG